MALGNPWQTPDDQEHDFGPWIETGSTRCNRYRYDYANSTLQVVWLNGRGHIVTAYRGVDTDTYRRFAQSASKGRFVNQVLNGAPGGYENIGSPRQAEADAPSNPNRSAVKHRVERSKRDNSGVRYTPQS